MRVQWWLYKINNILGEFFFTILFSQCWKFISLDLCILFRHVPRGYFAPYSEINCNEVLIIVNNVRQFSWCHSHQVWYQGPLLMFSCLSRYICSIACVWLNFIIYFYLSVYLCSDMVEELWLLTPTWHPEFSLAFGESHAISSCCYAAVLWHICDWSTWPNNHRVSTYMDYFLRSFHTGRPWTTLGYVCLCTCV